MTDINDTLYRHTDDMTWRDLAAIHMHVGLLTEHYYRENPAEAAKRAVQHVNALAMELERTEAADK